MATTIFCTLLILYRIVTHSHRPGGMGIRLFRGVIEIIVESALIYSISLLVYVILVARESSGGPYADVIASSARVGPLFSVFSVQLSYMTVGNRTDTYCRTSRCRACTARRVLERKYRIDIISSFRRHSEDQSEGTIDESVVEGGSEDRL